MSELFKMVSDKWVVGGVFPGTIFKVDAKERERLLKLERARDVDAVAKAKDNVTEEKEVVEKPTAEPKAETKKEVKETPKPKPKAKTTKAKPKTKK